MRRENDYFFKEDKAELNRFLFRLAKLGYKDIWVPDGFHVEVGNIAKHLESMRIRNAQIPPEALAADGNRMLPFWVNVNVPNNKESRIWKGMELCIDYSKKNGFYVKSLSLSIQHPYPGNESTGVSVLIVSIKSRLPGIKDMLRFANMVDAMRKKSGLKYLDKTFSSEDRLVKRHLRKNFLGKS